MPAKSDANSTTSSAVARGTIEIRENPTQDISALNRDTNNALNELGRIFDKEKIEEQQELAKVFGEEAFRLAHNLPDDGSGRKIAVHAIIGGIMSQITGAGFASGAIGAGVNEAVIGEIKKIKDPGTAQIVSAIVGAAAAKAVGGNAGAGATSAASGTKNNLYEKIPEIRQQLEEQLITEEYESLRENEYMPLYGEKDGRKVAVTIDRDGNIYDLNLLGDSSTRDRKIRLNSPLTENSAPFTIKVYKDYDLQEYPKEPTGEINVYRTGEYNGTITSILAPKGNAKTPWTIWKSRLINMSAGAVTSIDNNMSFGLLLHGYENVSKRNLGNKNDPWFLGAAATVDILSLGIGMEETYRGAGMLLGGSAIAPETAGVTLTISGFGAAAMVHGIATTSNAVSNFGKDSVQFIESLNNSATTALKGGDKIPSGAELSYHAAKQANDRNFTLKNIDDIILNNKKTRQKELHPNGEIRWRYQDKRGNTVITNEDGTRIITVYSHPASKNNEKYIPKN